MSALASPDAAVPAMLEVAHLSMHFEGITAIDDVSFSARRGEITGIIGPNGAGSRATGHFVSHRYFFRGRQWCRCR